MNSSARKPSLLALTLLCALATTSHAQGTFQDLDFEHPILPLNPVNFQVPTANAIPGWTAYTYGVSESTVVYNTLSLGAAAVSLQGPDSHEHIIQGSYTVILQGSTGSTPGSAAIGQTGMIPPYAKTLTFMGGIGLDDVSFAGQPLLSFITATTPNFDTYVADISAFAGQSGELLFTAPPNTEEILDNIQFSSNPLPEPQTWALLLCAAAALALKRRLPKT